MIGTAVHVRDLRPADWPEVSRIYAEGIATGNATFETDVPAWEAWDAAHLPEHRHTRRTVRSSAGSREVGTRERIGRLDGVWRDVVFLERRSEVVG